MLCASELDARDLVPGQAERRQRLAEAGGVYNLLYGSYQLLPLSHGICVRACICMYACPEVRMYASVYARTSVRMCVYIYM